MIELSIQVFGIGTEVLFPAPRIFKKDLIDIDAQWLTDGVNGFAVPPEQVRLQQTDIAFGYNLSAQLFGGNGHFSVDAQRASFSARNARGRADGDLLRQVVDRFLRHFAKEQFTISFSANVYAKAESAAIREEYLQRYRFDSRIVNPGVVGYIRVDNWPSDVRLAIEPALGTEDSLFLAWTTKFPAGEISGIPDKVVAIFAEAASVYGLQLQPLV
jgi:hypothetical protein